MAPCAACKLLRRRCSSDCVFAPYFPGHDPHTFAIAHRVFGASNIHKMLKEVPVESRADAVKSMVYEAQARMRDPVYGCVGIITRLHKELCSLSAQLSQARHDICTLKSSHAQLEAQAQDQAQSQAQSQAQAQIELFSYLDEFDFDSDSVSSLFL